FIQLNPKMLLLGGEGKLLFFGVMVIKIRTGGIDDTVPFLPIVLFLFCHSLFADFHGPYRPFSMVDHIFGNASAEQVHKACTPMGCQSNHIGIYFFGILDDSLFFGCTVIYYRNCVSQATFAYEYFI